MTWVFFKMCKSRTWKTGWTRRQQLATGSLAYQSLCFTIQINTPPVREDCGIDSVERLSLSAPPAGHQRNIKYYSILFEFMRNADCLTTTWKNLERWWQKNSLYPPLLWNYRGRDVRQSGIRSWTCYHDVGVISLTRKLRQEDKLHQRRLTLMIVLAGN